MSEVDDRPAGFMMNASDSQEWGATQVPAVTVGSFCKQLGYIAPCGPYPAFPVLATNLYCRS